MDYDTLRRRLVQAIADPGIETPRGGNYEESIPSWSARAVILVLERLAEEADDELVIITDDQPSVVILTAARAGRLNRQLTDAQIDDLLAVPAPVPAVRFVVVAPTVQSADRFLGSAGFADLRHSIIVHDAQSARRIRGITTGSGYRMEFLGWPDNPVAVEKIRHELIQAGWNEPILTSWQHPDGVVDTAWLLESVFEPPAGSTITQGAWYPGDPTLYDGRQLYFREPSPI